MLYDALETFALYGGLAGAFTMLGCFINAKYGWPYVERKITVAAENAAICKTCTNNSKHYQLRR